MPKISLKGQQMPESPIRKLVPYAEEAKRKGRKVFHLNIGQPDIETPEVALNAVRNYDHKVIEYSHSAGILSFRESLVKYYKSVNIDVSPDQIIVGAGASKLCCLLFKVLWIRMMR